MFRELDQRHSHGLTVTLEWDPATGNVQVLCENRDSPEANFAHLVDPKDARHAFLHPFALRPSRGDSDQSVSTPDHGAVAGRKRRKPLVPPFNGGRGRSRGPPREVRVVDVVASLGRPHNPLHGDLRPRVSQMREINNPVDEVGIPDRSRALLREAAHRWAGAAAPYRVLTVKGSLRFPARLAGPWSGSRKRSPRLWTTTSSVSVATYMRSLGKSTDEAARVIPYVHIHGDTVQITFPRAAHRGVRGHLRVAIAPLTPAVSGSLELDGARVSQADLLRRGRSGRALRGLAVAATVLRRGLRVVPVAAVAGVTTRRPIEVFPNATRR